MATESTTTTRARSEISDPGTDATTGASERPEADPEPGAEFPVSIDNIFEILKNQRRRQVLTYLSAVDGSVSLRELSEVVAAEENDKPVDQLGSQERKRVYVGLYQVHLPKMDDRGFVTYDKDSGIIEAGPAAEYTERYLRRTESSDPSWPRYYVGLVAVGWLLFVGNLVASVVSPLVTSVVFLALLTSVVLTHAYSAMNGPDAAMVDTVSADA